MAKDDELELDTSKGGGGKGKLIVIIVLVVLLTAGGVIGGLYFAGMLGGGDAGAEAGATEEENKEVTAKPAFYQELQPAFVVNFEEQTDAAYLQVEMQVMVHDQAVLSEVTKHMPVIRNNILLILSAQKYDVVKTRAGKEALQQTILEAIQAVLDEANKDQPAEEGQEPHKIEQVYFTSFIMQ